MVLRTVLFVRSLFFWQLEWWLTQNSICLSTLIHKSESALNAWSFCFCSLYIFETVKIFTTNERVDLFFIDLINFLIFWLLQVFWWLLWSVKVHSQPFKSFFALYKLESTSQFREGFPFSKPGKLWKSKPMDALILFKLRNRK